jgi:hypothetical protein
VKKSLNWLRVMDLEPTEKTTGSAGSAALAAGEGFAAAGVGFGATGFAEAAGLA